MNKCTKIILFCAFIATISALKLTTRPYQIATYDVAHCNKTKCPTSEDPLCVRLKYMSSGLTVHVIALNKCEFQYAKCLKGITAEKVAMKNCHNVSAIPENKRIEHKRYKRQLQSKDDSSDEIEDLKELSSEVDRRIQYNADCPKVCPANPAMVCGLLGNGIFKTFLSVCHMRMYSCRNGHGSRGLHLHSRYPCILTAPYLTGKERKLGDGGPEDIVLMHIFCRFKNGDDERCKHVDAKLSGYTDETEEAI